MSAALITATIVGIVGLGYSAILGFTAASAADLFFHTSFGIFSTLVTLLSHSMTMFYLIGKGKAIREAVTEGQLSPDLYYTVARARRPVFSVATLAMMLTMITAILGGGVDTGAIPTGVHLVIAVLAITANLIGLRVEVIAMVSSSQIVSEVNELLKEQP
mgnify:FL=1